MVMTDGLARSTRWEISFSRLESKDWLKAIGPFIYDPSQAATIPYFKRLYPYSLHYDSRGLTTLLFSLTRHDMTPYLPDITAPTLITSGEADRTVPIQQAMRAAEQMPNVRLAFIPRAGHFAHLENLPDALALFRDFLSETGHTQDHA